MKNNNDATSRLRASNGTSRGLTMQESRHQMRQDSKSQLDGSPGRDGSNSRVPTSLLKIEQFIRTVRKSTDLAHRIDWPLLTEREHHTKVIDICQLVINDLFLFLGNSYQLGGSKSVVEDFLKTFYPELAPSSDAQSIDIKN